MTSTQPDPSSEPIRQHSSVGSETWRRRDPHPIHDAQLLADLEEARAEVGPGTPWSEFRKELLK